MSSRSLFLPLTAVVCVPIAAATAAPKEAVGPFPLGRPTYAQIATKLLPAAESSGRRVGTRKYTDLGLPLLGGFVSYDARTAGDYLEQEVSVPAQGDYELVLWTPRGPRCGKFVVVVDGQRLGPEVDGYAAKPANPQAIPLGELRLGAGTHRVKLLCTGRNSRSTGTQLWVDCYLVRPKPVGGLLTQWQVNGPYTSGQAAASPPESGWKPAVARSGILDLGKVLGRTDNAVAWARTVIHAPRDLNTLLWVGSDDGVTVFLNGQEVDRFTGERPALPDQDLARVTLHEGANPLLCRVTNVRYDWQLLVRVQDPNGNLKASVPPLPRPQLGELTQLGNRLKGFVVWESNRTGQWQLYRINTDGSGFRQLSHFPASPLAYRAYLRPRVSPEGRTILFAYGSARRPCEVWTMPAAGGEARKLTVGCPLNWSRDGTRLYFLRDYHVWVYELTTGKEGRLSDTKVGASGKEGGTVGCVRPDEKAVVVRTARCNEYVVFGTPTPVKRMSGCEARITAEGKYVYWVHGPKHFFVWQIGTRTEHEFFGEPPGRWNYTYFPTVTPDNHWLVYGASPGQHSHETSDYEIYLQELNNWKPVGRPVRLSFNPRTDRWPYLYLEQ